MKVRILVILLVFVCHLKANCQSKFDYLIGKNIIQLSEVPFQIDSNTKAYFIYTDYDSSGVLTNIISFQDTVILIQNWKDDLNENTENNQLINEIRDANKYEIFKEYFISKYDDTLNVTNQVKGLADVKQTFGLHCGASGEPVEYGWKYLELEESNLTLKQKKDYLTSINPVHQLYGYLLIKSGNPYSKIPFLKLVKHSQFKISFCYGCGGSSLLAIENIIKELR